jgi:hypothetical protein
VGIFLVLILLIRALPSKPSHLPNVLPPATIILRVGISADEWGLELEHILPIAICKGKDRIISFCNLIFSLLLYHEYLLVLRNTDMSLFFKRILNLL